MHLNGIVDGADADGARPSSATVDEEEVQLPVTFSEQVTVIENGPSRDCSYESRLEYVAERNYMESVQLQPKFVPVKYRSTVIVDNCQLVTTNGDVERVDVDEEESCVTFYEHVYLLPKLVAKHFGSTVYSYPKEAKMTYETVLNYNVNSKDRLYVVGLRYPAGVNLLDLGDKSKLLAAAAASGAAEDGGGVTKMALNGGRLSNGGCPAHDDGQLFISTKEWTIIKGIAVTSL